MDTFSLINSLRVSRASLRLYLSFSFTCGRLSSLRWILPYLRLLPTSSLSGVTTAMPVPAIVQIFLSSTNSTLVYPRVILLFVLLQHSSLILRDPFLAYIPAFFCNRHLLDAPFISPFDFSSPLSVSNSLFRALLSSTRLYPNSSLQLNCTVSSNTRFDYQSPMALRHP